MESSPSLSFIRSMKPLPSLSFILLIVVVLSFLASQATAANVSFKYQVGRSCGVFSPVMQAQETGNCPSQYFVCKVAFRESRWTKNLWNCNCGNRRSNIFWRKWKCDWCVNEFWTQTNAMKVTYCAYYNWDKQIERVFETGNTGSRDWREVACPRGQYASKIGGRLGNQHETDTGFVGTQILCETIDFSQKTLVNDSYVHKLSQISRNKQGCFVSSVQIKYEPKGKLTGVRWGFESMPMISKISVKYAKQEILNPTSTIIESVIVANNGSKIAQQQVGFTKSHTIKDQWTTSESLTSGYTISLGVSISPIPMFTKATATRSTYSSKSSTFGFNKEVTRTFSSSQKLTVMVPPGKVVEVSSIIQEQKVSVPFQATLTFIDRFTEELIGEKVVKGVWEGVMASTVTTDINEYDIPAK